MKSKYLEPYIQIVVLNHDFLLLAGSDMPGGDDIDDPDFDDNDGPGGEDIDNPVFKVKNIDPFNI
ncbi:MAG: hypothetical protein IJV27_12920 [Prevotella sp.]|nr:hypothetical protein [Prevotella sp.]